MINNLIKNCPYIIAMVLSLIIYMLSDKKYRITDKINLYIKIDEKRREGFYVSCTIISVFIIGIIGIYVVPISNEVYSIISGIITGIFIGLTTKVSKKKTKKKFWD